MKPHPPPDPAPTHDATSRLVPGFAALLACWLAGEALVTLLPFALPGTIAGLLLLCLLCLVCGRVPTAIAQTSRGLLGHLSLLFVPAGVGIIEHGELLMAHGWGMLLTLLLSTLVTLAVTALSLKWLLARQDRGR